MPARNGLLCGSSPAPRAKPPDPVRCERNALPGACLLLTQGLEQSEALQLDEFRLFRVPVIIIEKRTLLRFPYVVRIADEICSAGIGFGDQAVTTRIQELDM